MDEMQVAAGGDQDVVKIHTISETICIPLSVFQSVVFCYSDTRKIVVAKHDITSEAIVVRASHDIAASVTRKEHKVTLLF